MNSTSHATAANLHAARSVHGSAADSANTEMPKNP